MPLQRFIPERIRNWIQNHLGLKKMHFSGWEIWLFDPKYTKIMFFGFFGDTNFFPSESICYLIWHLLTLQMNKCGIQSDCTSNIVEDG